MHHNYRYRHRAQNKLILYCFRLQRRHFGMRSFLRVTIGPAPHRVSRALRARNRGSWPEGPGRPCVGRGQSQVKLQEYVGTIAACGLSHGGLVACMRFLPRKTLRVALLVHLVWATLHIALWDTEAPHPAELEVLLLVLPEKRIFISGSCAILVAPFFARCCDTIAPTPPHRAIRYPLKEAHNSVVILSLQVSRDMKSIAAKCAIWVFSLCPPGLVRALRIEQNPDMFFFAALSLTQRNKQSIYSQKNSSRLYRCL